MDPKAKEKLQARRRAMALLGASPFKLSGQSRSCAFRLEAGAVEEKSATWIQVAYEGAWKGHVVGPFEFSKDDLQQMVDNLHRHPSFKPGADSAPSAEVDAGDYDVIPFDWRHISEGPAGAAPVELQVAQAWALDFAVRDGEGGKAELWALCRYLEPMRSLVKAQKVKWTSITAYPHAIDPASAEDIGWYISSIAFTNDPFLQGMASVAADRGLQELAKKLGYYYDAYCPPSSPKEVAEALRCLFELSVSAGLGEIIAELAKLKSWAVGGQSAPIGVDMDALVGTLRRIFNLPTLSSPVDVFAEADTLLEALAADEAVQSSRTPAVNAGLTKEGQDMDPKFIKLVASKLGIPADEEAVQKAIVARLDAGESSTSSLKAVISALGVENPDEAMKKIASMFQSVEALEKAMPELKSLREGQADDEEKSAEKEVDQAMTAYRMPAAAKKALLAMRLGLVARPAKDAPADAFAKFLTARREAKMKFTAEYPPVDADKKHLSQTVHAGPGGAPPPKSAGDVIDVKGEILETGGVNLTGLPGRNEFEKCIAFAGKQMGDQAWAKLTYEQKHRAGREVMTQLRAERGQE